MPCLGAVSGSWRPGGRATTCQQRLFKGVSDEVSQAAVARLRNTCLKQQMSKPYGTSAIKDETLRRYAVTAAPVITAFIKEGSTK